MVQQKRTYSQRDKKAAEQEARRKRSKSGDDNEIRPSSSHRVESPQKSHSLLKKGLKKYGGPTSIPKNEDDTIVTEDSKEHTSVFDKALNGKFKPMTHKQQSIYGSREDFEEAIKKQSLVKKSNGNSAKPYLPTPPSELQKKQSQQLNRFFPGLNGASAKLANPVKPSITKPIANSKLATKKTEQNDKLEQLYIAKQYEANRISAPRRDLLGDHLPSKSAEARLWSINQANSLFLRLPGEIRNRIYGYVLGGNTIMIGYETYQSTYKNVVPVFRYHCTVFSERTNPFKDSQQPHVKISSGLTFLNNICRQLYLETAALPYKLNMMAFESHNIMVNFILIEQRLSRQQRHAFTQLVLPDNLPGANMLAYLPNLEKVFLGFARSYDISKGWYNVIREDGKKPKLSKHYTRYYDNIASG